MLVSASINNYPSDEMFSPSIRDSMLRESMELHNHRLIHHRITTLYQKASNFSPKTIERLSKFPPRTLKEDPTVVFSVELNFGNAEAFGTALFTARTFREYGHRIRVFLSGHSFIDLNKAYGLLEELIEAGQIDVNDEMKRASGAGNFTLVFFFLSHGAQIELFEGIGMPPSHILLDAIHQGDFSTIKALVDYGVLINARLINVLYILDLVVIRKKRDDIAKLLIYHQAKTDSVWKLIESSQERDLYLDALEAGYELNLDLAKAIVADLIKNH